MKNPLQSVSIKMSKVSTDDCKNFLSPYGSKWKRTFKRSYGERGTVRTFVGKAPDGFTVTVDLREIDGQLSIDKITKNTATSHSYTKRMVAFAALHGVKLPSDEECIAQGLEKQLLWNAGGDCVAWLNKKGKLHNPIGPACIMPTADGLGMFWYKDDEHHREDGPAQIREHCPFGNKVWNLNGKEIEKEDFTSLDMIVKMQALELFTPVEIAAMKMKEK